MSFAYRPAHPTPVGSPEPVVSESPSARTDRPLASAAVVAGEDEELDESPPHPTEARAPSAKMATPDATKRRAADIHCSARMLRPLYAANARSFKRIASSCSPWKCAAKPPLILLRSLTAARSRTPRQSRSDPP